MEQRRAPRPKLRFPPAPPSKIATMICRYEAIQEIGSALGVKATVSAPTSADHLYSCQYGYPTGSMVLSVKGLSSWGQTKAYFEQLARQMGVARTIQNLGQGAFQTTNGFHGRAQGLESPPG